MVYKILYLLLVWSNGLIMRDGNNFVEKKNKMIGLYIIK